MQKMASLTIILASLVLGLESPAGHKKVSFDDRPKSDERLIIRLISTLQIKTPYRYQNLTIFPITSALINESEYLTLEQGINNGQVEIREINSGEVNLVKIKNRGSHHIFGLAGELIIGAKQDRMLKEDILLPPYSRWLEIPVYCTEHGRWTEQTKTFQSRGLMATGKLRAQARKTESQAEVWDGVRGSQAELGVAAPTQAFKEVYEAPAVKDQSEPYLKELLPMPKKSKSTIGVIVAVGDEIICADLFVNHSLFDRLWEKLLRSYVIDALSKPKGEHISLEEVRDFLDHLREASFTHQPTPGAGRLVRINSSINSGSALIFNDDVVHLDLFPGGIIDYDDFEGPAPRLDIRRGRPHR